jgi:hypothetical protein
LEAYHQTGERPSGHIHDFYTIGYGGREPKNFLSVSSAPKKQVAEPRRGLVAEYLVKKEGAEVDHIERRPIKISTVPTKFPIS